MNAAVRASAFHVRVHSYDRVEHTAEESTLEPALDAIGRRMVTWICISGKFDMDLLEIIGRHLDIDPYEIWAMVEHSRGRARLEDLGSALFLSWSTARNRDGVMEVHPAYFILGPDYLVSIREEDGEHFGEIVERLRNDRSRLRKSGPGYLLYALLNDISDELFDRMEETATSIDELEDRLLDDTRRETLRGVGQMREQVNALWKTVWPLREAANALSARRIAALNRGDQMYFGELSGALDLLLKELDALSQIIPQLIDIYETAASNQLNQIVKVLTVFSVVFIPLNLIAAIYGMRFENMPEVEHFLGYPAVLLLMLSISAGMPLYFYKKGWIFFNEKRA